jgi:hypothetical protein
MRSGVIAFSQCRFQIRVVTRPKLASSLAMQRSPAHISFAVLLLATFLGVVPVAQPVLAAGLFVRPAIAATGGHTVVLKSEDRCGLLGQ